MNKIIEQVDSFKYLGVELDEKWSGENIIMLYIRTYDLASGSSIT